MRVYRRRWGEHSPCLDGPARAHSLLGNTKQATYFYQYLSSQLKHADEGNLAVREAENWASSSKSKIAAEKLVGSGQNYLPVS